MKYVFLSCFEHNFHDIFHKVGANSSFALRIVFIWVPYKCQITAAIVGDLGHLNFNQVPNKVDLWLLIQSFSWSKCNKEF